MAETLDGVFIMVQHARYRLLPYVNFHGLDAWEKSFAARQSQARGMMIELVNDDAANRYTGDVGDHSLTLAGVTVHSENGYAGLLRDWLDAARAKLEGGAA